MIRVWLLSCLALIAVSSVARADQVDGLYASAYGDPAKPAVVFLHGGPGYNSFSFEFSTAQPLADRGFYVIVYDQRGSGRSKAAEDPGDFTYGDAVSDLRAVLAHFQINKATLLGHSFGGTIAVRFASEYPNAVRAVVLIDAPMDQRRMVRDILTNCEESLQKLGSETALSEIHQLQDLIFPSAHRYVIDAQLGSRVFIDALGCGLYKPHAPTALSRELWTKLSASPGHEFLNDSRPEPFAGFMANEQWLSLSSLSALKALPMPVYGAFGADDGLFSPASLKTLSSEMPSGHFRKIEDASHNLFIDQQPAFLDFVTAAARIP